MPDRLSGRHFSLGRVLAELQRSDISYDRPTIARLNLRRVIRHGAESIGHHVEEISQRRLAQPLDVIGRRPAEPALWDHSVAIPEPGVTGGAINIEPFTAASQNFLANREGHEIAGRVAYFPRVKIRVGA